MKCPYCDADNLEGEYFCGECGARLHDAGSADATLISASQDSVDTSHAEIAGEESQVNGLTTTSTLTPNTRLQDGRYVVTRILGQGGMGAAVLAHDTRISNKLVVIKELIPDETDLAHLQEAVRNFKREVETLAKLDHPLIPAVTDSFEEGERYFMVQEYVAGETLEDHMELLKQPMSEQEALTYTSQVLDILQYLAQQQPPIVHRDIKPANIIISSRDKLAHLVDFGIARTDEMHQAKQKQTSALGTAGYAPLEQYQGNADARSDLYALAATLHFLLTDRDPREGQLFVYPRVRTLNTQISLETERILERALKQDITQRYQSAAEMKQEIDELLRRDFHTSSEGSVYLRGSSGTLAPSRSGIPPAPPAQPARPEPPEPVSPVPSSYSAGLRPLPRSESGPPYRPYKEPWYDRPYSESYRQGQMQEQIQEQMWQTRERQQQMFMQPTPNQTQSENRGFVIMSFIFLLAVVTLIAIFLFLSSYPGVF